MTAAARLFARLEPLAYADDDNDNALENLATALMTPVEIGEITRDDDTHIAWSKLRDPDECPAELLDWLAVDQGIVFPASALTEAEKRSRITQAAGRYRGTEQAWREEIQRSLTGNKVVRLLTFVGGDRWAVTILTRTNETPDPDAVERTARAGKPAGVVLTFLTTDDVIWAEGASAWDDVDPSVTWAAVVLADVD